MRENHAMARDEPSSGLPKAELVAGAIGQELPIRLSR